MVKKIKLINKTTHEEINITNGVDSPFVIDFVDWGTVQTNFNTYRIPTIIGLKKQSSSINERTVVIVGYVISKEKNTKDNWNDWLIENEKNLVKNKEKLNKVLCPFDEIEIVADNKYRITGNISESILYSSEDIENNEVFCKFQITINCFYPLFDTGEILPEYSRNAFEFTNNSETEEGIKIETKIKSTVTTGEKKITIEGIGDKNKITFLNVPYIKNDKFVYDTTDGKVDTYLERSGEKINIVNCIDSGNIIVKAIRGYNRITLTFTNMSDSSLNENTLSFKEHHSYFGGM